MWGTHGVVSAGGSVELEVNERVSSAREMLAFVGPEIIEASTRKRLKMSSPG